MAESFCYSVVKTNKICEFFTQCFGGKYSALCHLKLGAVVRGCLCAFIFFLGGGGREEGKMRAGGGGIQRQLGL